VKFQKLGPKRWVNLEHIASVVDTSAADAPACAVRFLGSEREETFSGEEARALLECLSPTPPAEWKGPATPFKEP